MKGFLNNILIALFLSLYGAQDSFSRPSPTPTATPSRDLVCRTKQQDLELRDWIVGVQNEAHKANAENDAAQKSNAALQALVASAQTDAQNLANECAADKKCAQAPLSCWFHRLLKHILWVIVAIVVVIAALCIASFFFPALGPILSFLVGIWNKILGMFKPKP